MKGSIFHILYMKVNKIYCIYFSPTGNTKKAVETIGQTLKKNLQVEMECVDITTLSVRKKQYQFTADDLIILGVPTYAGRIPNKIVQEIKTNFIGNQTPIVYVVTYGNRNYDSALNECVSIGLENSMYPIAACTLACEHAFTEKLASHRPDSEDIVQMQAFSNKLAQKLEAYTVEKEEINLVVNPYYIPLKQDGSPAKFLKAKPKTNMELCTNCKQCVSVCPMNSIDAEDVSQVNGICIKCQACVQVCKEHAKYFDDEEFLSHVAMLESTYSKRKENQFWMR